MLGDLEGDEAGGLRETLIRCTRALAHERAGSAAG
jgi:hypothetical protein